MLDKNVVGLGKMEIVDREGATFSNNCEDKAFLFTYLKGPNLQNVKGSIDLSNIVTSHY